LLSARKRTNWPRLESAYHKHRNRALGGWGVVAVFMRRIYLGSCKGQLMGTAWNHPIQLLQSKSSGFFIRSPTCKARQEVMHLRVQQTHTHTHEAPIIFQPKQRKKDAIRPGHLP
jgi:hypothetical protein